MIDGKRMLAVQLDQVGVILVWLQFGRESGQECGIE